MKSLKCEVCEKVIEGHTQNQIQWSMSIHKLTHKPFSIKAEAK